MILSKPALLSLLPALVVLTIAHDGLAQFEDFDERKESKAERRARLDREQQQQAPGARFRGGGAGNPVPNIDLPGHLVAPAGELTLLADFKNADDGQVPLFLVNRTDKTVSVPCQDNDPYLKLEMRDEDGHWVRVQNHLDSFCGNSYYMVELGAGQHFRLLGYLPEEGTPALVRYRAWSSLPLISNTAPGHYLEADRIAASLDLTSAQEIPHCLHAVLGNPLVYPANPAELTPHKRLVALRWLSHYRENAYHRRETVRYLETLGPGSPEREEIAALLTREWPRQVNADQLLNTALDVASGDPKSELARSVAEYPELAWGMIEHFLEGRITVEDEIGRADARFGKAFATISVALRSERNEVVRAALELANHRAAVDEHVATSLLFEWLEMRNEVVTAMAANHLARRGEFEALATTARDWEEKRRLAVLQALASAGFGRGANHFPRNPEGKVEREFWLECATAHPVEVAGALFFLGADGERNRFNLTLHEPLKRHLEKEAELGQQSPEKVTDVRDAYPLSRLVRFVGGWKRESDLPVFEMLLEHPAYQWGMSTGDDGQPVEVRRYRIREEARRILISMGRPVPQNLVLDERVPITPEVP